MAQGSTSGGVNKPLAIVYYEKILPGSRIGHRLADLGWRVSEVKAAADLATLVRQQTPILVVAELGVRAGDVCGVLAELMADAGTSHVPVLGFADPKNPRLSESALKAGVRLVAAETGFLDQLPHLIEHILSAD